MKEFIRTTEQDSLYRHLDKMSVQDLLININKEDKKVPEMVEEAIPQISLLVEAVVDKMLVGGRLFYIGAGTSGRLAVVDASECPPTYGVPHGLVIGIIAGGQEAMFNAVEFAEDNNMQAWHDLEKHQININDVVIGIAASGTTPYVIGGLQQCNERGILIGSISKEEYVNKTDLIAEKYFEVKLQENNIYHKNQNRIWLGLETPLQFGFLTNMVIG
jgi:N-acetylmuramic acid 6-phosphate etherase